MRSTRLLITSDILNVARGHPIYRAVRVPQTVILNESSLELVRQQEQRTGLNPFDKRIVQYKSEQSLKLTPNEVEFSLVPQVWDDTVSVFNALNPEQILSTNGLTSRDLLLARIPVGTPDLADGPRDLASTHSATRAYVSLEQSGRIAVIDLMTLQQVDTRPETPEIDSIQLPVGAKPRSIVISPDDRYAYIGDYQTGNLYILDIEPLSPTFHQTIEIISLATASSGLRSLTINADGSKLLATTPDSATSGKGQIGVFNIDPDDRPQGNSFNAQRWHDLIGVIEAEAGTEGITATPDPSILLFTNRRDEAKGLGRLVITNSQPTSFAAITNYTALGIGSTNDEFDVNEAMSVVVTRDGQYAFVAGRNGRLFGSGIPSIDGQKAGSNVGIIKNPLTDQAQLVAATRPIPMGLTSDLMLSGDDKYLFASYPGVGSVFAFDVEEIVETLNHPGQYLIDHLGRGTGSPVFNPLTQHSATVEDLRSVPIDNLNPEIAIASDLQWVKDSYLSNEFELGVPLGSNRAPLAIGGNPWSVTSASYRDWLDLVSPGEMTSDLTPTFTWKFDIPEDQVQEVHLFLSTFEQGEGLLPWDEIVDWSDPKFLPKLSEQEKRHLLTKNWNGYEDLNSGRILTATWKKETNTWYWHDGKTAIAQATDAPLNTNTRLTLADVRTLTGGQDYYWAVQAINSQDQSNLDFGQFQTTAPSSTSPFSSVTMLTHGFDPFTLLPGGSSLRTAGIPNGFYELADLITQVKGELPEQRGLILRYDKPTGLWVPVDSKGSVLTEVTGGLQPGDTHYLSTLANNLGTQYVNQNKPLVLLPEWSTQGESVISDSGFTEGAADAIFASLVQLDQALGGDVGEHDAQGNLLRLYDNEGDLIRHQGALFNSPLHFIGFSRGTVVNSEIIQRLGTYFPYAGGFVDSQGNPVKDAQGKLLRDLQMTTIDPHDFRQESLKIDLVIPGSPTLNDFRDFQEPSVQVWENVTFADNYYQTVANPQGATWTPNGRFLEGADVNILLNGRTGFTEDDRRGGPHNHAFTWYGGTLDLSLDEIQSIYEPPSDFPPIDGVYDQFGEESLGEWLDGQQENPALSPWYLTNGSQGSTEGIGTGWAYSILGGGKRPVVDLTKRISVDEDNTDEDIVEGDFAVPTVFNGNFEVGLSDDPNAPVPGWSFHNGEQPLLRKYLVDVSTIPTLGENATNTQVSLAAISSTDPQLESRKNFAVKLGDGNPTDFIHNPLEVFDWGVLRFDVHAPVLANFDDLNSFLSVSVKDDTGKFVPLKSKNPKTYYPNFDDSGYEPNPNSPAVDLREVQVVDPLTIQGQTNRIGYGQRGFETFFVDVPAELRGTSREIQFELTGSANQVVYLDNIAFQSFDLRFGMPKLNGQEARDEVNTTFETNYLSEKPQYTLSYNRSTRLSNWVSWHLDSTWIEGSSRPKTDFAEDISLPFPGERVTDNDYKSNKPPKEISYNGGHLAAASDRKRDSKDAYLTFLTSNIIPQSSKSNAGDSPWNALEEYTQKLAKAGKDIYITAGGLKAIAPPVLDTDQPLTGIEIPTHAWKLIFVLNQPGLSITDIQKNPDYIEDVIAVLIPNVGLDTTFPNTLPIPAYPYQVQINNQEEWKDWRNWRVSLRELQKVTKLNFFSGLNSRTRDIIQDKSLEPIVLSSFLLADTQLADYSSTIVGANKSSSVRHDGVVVEGSVSHQYSLETVSRNRAFKISSNQDSEIQVNTLHPSIIQMGIRQISPLQVGTTEVSFFEVSTSQVSISQVGTLQVSTAQTYASQISTSQNGTTEIGSHHPRSHQIDSYQVGPSQVCFDETNTRQISPSQVSAFEIDSSEIPLSSSIPSKQLFSIHNLTSPSIYNINNTALTLWNSLLKPQTQFDLNLIVKDLPVGQLAKAVVTQFDSIGRPLGGTILIDDDANGIGWFIDSTPFDNSEFTTSLTDTTFRATTGAAAGKYDLLTTILHEMGHLAGFISGHEGFDSHIQTLNGFPTFIGNNFNARLTSDRSHLDSTFSPYDLMNTTLTPGVRKLPSLLDLQILNTVRSGISLATNPTLQAPLTSAPLVAILNGDFDINNPNNLNFGWKQRGSANILNGQALLSEDSPFLSQFTQTFVIPEGAKTLQFTLIDPQLGQSDLAPPDVLEVALLDANTFKPGSVANLNLIL